jgi:hypothetical protein
VTHGAVLGPDGGSKTKGLRAEGGGIVRSPLAGSANIASVGVEEATRQLDAFYADPDCRHWANPMSSPSTLDTNRHRISGCSNGRSASYVICGPRSEPPMPRLTTVDRVAGVTAPFSGPDPLGERRRPVQHLVDSGHDVASVHLDALPAGGAQRDVQHRATLGRVDALAAEHRLDPRLQPAGLGELDDGGQHLGDEMLRVVQGPPPRRSSPRSAPGPRRTGRADARHDKRRAQVVHRGVAPVSPPHSSLRHASLFRDTSGDRQAPASLGPSRLLLQGYSH